MRKPIIVGNWKMNNGNEAAHTFYHELETLINENGGQDAILEKVDWAIAAPFTSIVSLYAHDEDGLYIPIAAQNVNANEKGAFTGEISISMLQELGVEYVIIGHSERREMFNETDESVNAKIKAVVKTFDSEDDYIVPIVAYGETEAQFDAGETLSVVEKQLKGALAGLDMDDVRQIVLAYEPIWAIGTGKTATPQQAQDVIKASRDIVAELYGQEVANDIRIQYGGSMNPGNIKELMAMPDIDGGLVGGASLEAKSFFDLITFNK